MLGNLVWGNLVWGNLVWGNLVWGNRTLGRLGSPVRQWLSRRRPFRMARPMVVLRGLPPGALPRPVLPVHPFRPKYPAWNTTRAPGNSPRWARKLSWRPM